MKSPSTIPAQHAKEPWRPWVERASKEEGVTPRRSSDRRAKLIEQLAETLQKPADRIHELATSSDDASDQRQANVKTSGGHSLRAEVHRAQRDSRGTIIFVHGFCGNRQEDGLFVQLAKTVANSGFDAVLYDWRGIGDSEGDFAKTTFEEHVDDFLAIAEWAEGQSATNNVLSVAFSLGAAVVGTALKKGGVRLSSAIYLSPAVRPFQSMLPRYEKVREEIERYGKAKKPGTSIELGPEAIESLEVDLGEGAFDVEIPLFVCHGTNDARIPHKHTEQLLPKDYGTSFRHFFFEGASHSFRPDDTYWDLLGAAASLWFEDPGAAKSEGTFART